MSEAQLVEARTKADVQRIEAQAKADAQRLQAQIDADIALLTRAAPPTPPGSPWRPKWNPFTSVRKRPAPTPPILRSCAWKSSLPCATLRGMPTPGSTSISRGSRDWTPRKSDRRNCACARARIGCMMWRFRLAFLQGYSVGDPV